MVKTCEDGEDPKNSIQTQADSFLALRCIRPLGASTVPGVELP